MGSKTWRVAALAGGFVALTQAGIADPGSVSVIGSHPGQACADDAARVAAGFAADRQALVDCADALRNQAMARVDLAVAHLNRGVIEQALAEPDLALADYDQSLELDPTLAAAYLDRGTLYEARHQFADAVDDFTKAIALAPAHPEQAYFDRAVAHEDRGDARAAYADYREAARLAPDWDLPKRQLARFTVRRRAAVG